MFLQDAHSYITTVSATWNPLDCWEPHNGVHIWCLQYVYQPRIDAHLRTFSEGWNRKPISTAENKTPSQLWFSGLYAIAQSQNRIAEETSRHDLEVTMFTIGTQYSMM